MSIIMVHGGADAKTAPPYMEAVRRAALAGFAALEAGLISAAEEAVKVLEDCPLFNAGLGSVLNLEGRVEMDASLMDGLSGRFGAVAAIRDVDHPVSVARRVLEDTPHVLLAGEGATSFARSMGFLPVNCTTPEMLAAWQRARDQRFGGTQSKVSPFTGLPRADCPACDTVGCVVSSRGATAAASSTGGSFLKLPGRVGDTPIIGGGIFASRRGAVVCTGLGEAFIETLTAGYVDSLLEQGLHPQQAAEKAIARVWGEKGAVGGILVADSLGRWGAAHNTRSFPVALMVDGTMSEDFIPQRIS